MSAPGTRQHFPNAASTRDAEEACDCPIPTSKGATLRCVRCWGIIPPTKARDGAPTAAQIVAEKARAR